MAAGEWTFVACDGSGNALAELTRATGMSLTFTRNGVPECQFSLSHDDPECATILTALAQGTGGGVPTVKGYRAGRTGDKVLRFNGYLAGVSDESGADASTATFTFKGPFGRLLGEGTNRGRFLAPFLSAPTGFLPTALLSGSLPEGDYDYTVTALTALGETTPTITYHIHNLSAGGGYTFGWNAVGGASDYRFYRSTATSPPNGAAIGWKSSGGATSISDDGTGTAFTAGTPPTTNTAAVPVITFTATDAGAIASSLVEAASTDAATGLTTTGATVQPTKVRDRAYPRYTNVGDAIVNLTNVLDGFDFDVVPVDQGAVLGQFNVYASMGQDRPTARFEYGPTTLVNCSGVHRQTLPPINYVTIQGANGLSSVRTNAASITKYGRYELVETRTDVSEQLTLDDIASANLRPDPVTVLDFSPEPRLAPLPWDDYWIGDTVYLYVNRGGLVEGPLATRVNQIKVVIDPDSGLEAAAIPDPLTPEDERTIKASVQVESIAT